MLLRVKWQEMTKQAMRVLALAISETAVTEQGEFSRLILVGLVGIRDEIRPEARAAVAAGAGGRCAGGHDHRRQPGDRFRHRTGGGAAATPRTARTRCSPAGNWPA